MISKKHRLGESQKNYESLTQQVNREKIEHGTINLLDNKAETLEAEESFVYNKDTIPESLKETYFKDALMPDITGEFNAIGFDLDSCLI